MRSVSGWPRYGPRMGQGSYFIPGIATRSGVSLYAQMLAAIGSGASLYDPSDLTSLYQSRTGGSTGAVDSVVGIMLDKAQMGNKTAAAFISGQTNLVSNPGFDSDTAWVKGTGWTISGGTANASSVNGGTISQTILSDGVWYEVTFTVTGYSTGAVRVLVGNSQVGANRSADGTYTEILREVGDNAFYLQGVSNFTGSIDNVTVRAIPGSHALAPSDAARPILRSSGGLYYLDADGTDDWMNVTPTKNLGEQWWHVGGWKMDVPSGTSTTFTTSVSYRGSFSRNTSIGGVGFWYNSSDTRVTLVDGNMDNVSVHTIEQVSAGSISGRYNGGAATVITPYDDSGSAQGLALFTAVNSGFNSGLDGRFYCGVWNTGTISAANSAIVERWVASKCGVALP